MDIECGGFTFVSNFDSGNLARVELVPRKQNGKMFVSLRRFNMQNTVWMPPRTARSRVVFDLSVPSSC
jgi:hypothetical protein